MKINKVYLVGHIVYSGEITSSLGQDSDTLTIINNCKFNQTSYGSVIVERINGPTIEVYPSSIKHIIYKS